MFRRTIFFSHQSSEQVGSSEKVFRASAIYGFNIILECVGVFLEEID